MPRIAVVYYSLYGHIHTLASAFKKGAEKAGVQTDLYQVPETLSEEILKIVKAPPKPDIPIATVEMLKDYDGICFGVPTRYGSMPSQLKAFLDATGGLWANGTLYGKYASVMISTGTNAGNEATAFAMMSTFVHHGMIFVPLGYKRCFPQLSNINEVRAGGPWGAGTIAGPDGSRQPSALELEIAEIHGEQFADVCKRTDFSKPL